jgi:arsenate reductase (thioredoxin)
MSTQLLTSSCANGKLWHSFGFCSLIPALFLFVGVGVSAFAARASFAQEERQTASPPPTVVFICDHGAAKSVIAAAWFNNLASERHLPFHAIARGTNPQRELSESAAAGLQRNGLSVPSDKPQPLTAADTSHALRIVAFCPVPSSVKASRVDVLDVPGPNDGYQQSRDAILVHVKALLDELQKNTQHQ